MDGTANHFPAKNALFCRILHYITLQSRNFSAVMPRTAAGASPVLVTLFLLYKTTTGLHLTTKKSFTAIFGKWFIVYSFNIRLE